MSSINTLAPRLPLAIDSKFGYDMLVSVRQTTQQNLKCLLLTAPNERMMDPEFGVGLKRYLFENGSPQLNTDIKIRIRQQVKKYMPFITINEIQFSNLEIPIQKINEFKSSSNSIGLRKIKLNINYNITQLQINNQIMEIVVFVGG